MDTVVGIATFAGREASLAQTLATLAPQVDRVHLWDNATAAQDLADNGKFHGLMLESEPVVYLCCDDDLLYPDDYVATTLEALETHGGIVTYHGRVLLGMGLDYYRGHKTYHCLRRETYAGRLDVPGTGVCAFRTDVFNPRWLWQHTSLYMADVLLAWEALACGVRVTHVPHERGWLRYQAQPVDTIIAEWELGQAHRQAALADQIFLNRS